MVDPHGANGKIPPAEKDDETKERERLAGEERARKRKERDAAALKGEIRSQLQAMLPASGAPPTSSQHSHSSRVHRSQSQESEDGGSGKSDSVETIHQVANLRKTTVHPGFPQDAQHIQHSAQATTDLVGQAVQGYVLQQLMSQMQSLAQTVQGMAAVPAAVAPPPKASKPRPEFTSGSLAHQYDANCEWIDGLDEALLLVDNEPSKAKEHITKVLAAIKKRNALLEIGDKNKNVFKDLEVLKRADEWSELTGISKNDIIKYIRDEPKAKAPAASPAKRPRTEWSNRGPSAFAGIPPPFQWPGAPWPGQSTGNNFP